MFTRGSDTDRPHPLEADLQKCFNSVVPAGKLDEAGLSACALRNNKEHHKVCNALLYCILTDRGRSMKAFDCLRRIQRDSFEQVCAQAELIAKDFPRCMDIVVTQLMYLVQELIKAQVSSVSRVVVTLFYHLSSSKDKQSSLATILLLHLPWLVSSSDAPTLTFQLLNFLFGLDGSKGLPPQELRLCASLLKGLDVAQLASLGRDMVRLLENLREVAELKSVWNRLEGQQRPQDQSSWLDTALQTPTPSEVLRACLLPQLERDLLHVMLNVRLGSQNDLLSNLETLYFSQSYASNLIVSCARFVIAGCKDDANMTGVPRWAMLEWLLRCCRTRQTRKPCELAILWDVFYLGPRESLSAVAPAFVLMQRNLTELPEITFGLLQRVVNYVRINPEVQETVRSVFQRVSETPLVPSLPKLLACDDMKLKADLLLLFQPILPPPVLVPLSSSPVPNSSAGDSPQWGDAEVQQDSPHTPTTPVSTRSSLSSSSSASLNSDSINALSSSSSSAASPVTMGYSSPKWNEPTSSDQLESAASSSATASPQWNQLDENAENNVLTLPSSSIAPTPVSPYVTASPKWDESSEQIMESATFSLPSSVTYTVSGVPAPASPKWGESDNEEQPDSTLPVPASIISTLTSLPATTPPPTPPSMSGQPPSVDVVSASTASPQWEAADTLQAQSSPFSLPPSSHTSSLDNSSDLDSTQPFTVLPPSSQTPALSPKWQEGSDSEPYSPPEAEHTAASAPSAEFAGNADTLQQPSGFIQLASEASTTAPSSAASPVWENPSSSHSIASATSPKWEEPPSPSIASATSPKWENPPIASAKWEEPSSSSFASATSPKWENPPIASTVLENPSSSPSFASATSPKWEEPSSTPSISSATSPKWEEPSYSPSSPTSSKWEEPSSTTSIATSPKWGDSTSIATSPKWGDSPSSPSISSTTSPKWGATDVPTVSSKPPSDLLPASALSSLQSPSPLVPSSSFSPKWEAHDTSEEPNVSLISDDNNGIVNTTNSSNNSSTVKTKKGKKRKTDQSTIAASPHRPISALPPSVSTPASSPISSFPSPNITPSYLLSPPPSTANKSLFSALNSLSTTAKPTPFIPLPPSSYSPALSALENALHPANIVALKEILSTSVPIGKVKTFSPTVAISFKPLTGSFCPPILAFCWWAAQDVPRLSIAAEVVLADADIGWVMLYCVVDCPMLPIDLPQSSISLASPPSTSILPHLASYIASTTPVSLAVKNEPIPFQSDSTQPIQHSSFPATLSARDYADMGEVYLKLSHLRAEKSCQSLANVFVSDLERCFASCREVFLKLINSCLRSRVLVDVLEPARIGILRLIIQRLSPSNMWSLQIAVGEHGWLPDSVPVLEQMVKEMLGWTAYDQAQFWLLAHQHYSARPRQVLKFLDVLLEQLPKSSPCSFATSMQGLSNLVCCWSGVFVRLPLCRIFAELGTHKIAFYRAKKNRDKLQQFVKKMGANDVQLAEKQALLDEQNATQALHHQFTLSLQGVLTRWSTACPSKCVDTLLTLLLERRMLKSKRKKEEPTEPSVTSLSLIAPAPEPQATDQIKQQPIVLSPTERFGVLTLIQVLYESHGPCAEVLRQHDALAKAVQVTLIRFPELTKWFPALIREPMEPTLLGVNVPILKHSKQRKKTVGVSGLPGRKIFSRKQSGKKRKLSQGVAVPFA